MRRVAAAAVVMACGAKPPEPLPVVTPTTPPVAVIKNDPPKVRVPRPVVTVQDPHPDLSEEPRWPLGVMQHPTLEPQFNVAGVLADPGISWTELCARGAQLRHDPAHRDELAYLGAWCAAEHHDAAAAVTALVPLENSPVPGIANGIPFDIANVLVGELDADHAIQLLTDLKVRNAHLFDLLAAAYFEVGKDADAVRATSTAMQVDYHPVPADTCHRIAREVLLGASGWHVNLMQQLGNLATPVIGDHICDDLNASLRCAVDPPGDCRYYWASNHLTPDDAAIADAYERWDHPRDWLGWTLLAQNLEDAVTIAAGKDLALAAIDGAVVASECDEPRLSKLWVMFAETAARKKVPALLDKVKQLATLAKDRSECAQFRATWLAANPQ